MNSRKILDFILKYSIVLILLLPIIWFGYLMLYGGGFGMSYEIDNYKLNKLYTTIGKRWDIGKEVGFGNKICDSYLKKGCINGELKGIKINDNNEALIYFQHNGYNIRESSFGSGFTYNLFGPYDERGIDLKENIPKFGIIYGESIKLFSENDLSKLNSLRYSQFKELEKNPTIIIDGVNHTK